VERNGYFCFKEFFLLLSGRHTLKVYQNSLSLSSFYTLFLICNFEIVGRAERSNHARHDSTDPNVDVTGLFWVYPEELRAMLAAIMADSCVI
jgi:hypothetical protein